MRVKHQELITTEDNPDEASLKESHFDKVFTKHPCLYGFILVSISTLDVAQIANDWMFFQDVYILEKGLVYGPLNVYILMLILLSCGLGTLIFLFEILNLFYEVCSGKPWITLEVSFMVTVWFQELPMITVSFVITLCHNEPVSYFQLVKALLVIISLVLKIVIPLILTYLDRETPPSKRICKYVTKAFLAVGLSLMLCGAVAVFIFTHVIARDERQFQFRLPEEIWSGRFAYDTYFTNVGIYFHHVNLKSDGSTKTEIWIKLVEIDDFFRNDMVHVKLTYIESNKKIQKLMLSGYNETNLMFIECYTHGVNGIETYPYDKCSAGFIPKLGKHERLAFKFYFIRPRQRLLLGNIVYNAKYLKDSMCWTVTSNETNLFYPTKENTNPEKIGELLYLKHHTTTYNVQRLIHDSYASRNSTTHFFQTTDHTLLAADAIWVTGMYGCNCTGQKGPVMDTSMRVEC